MCIEEGMLTQKQVDTALKLFDVYAQQELPVTEIDRRVADRVNCSQETISRLRRGVRHNKGISNFVFSRTATTDCPRHGVVIGTYCVTCATQAYIRTYGKPLRPSNDTRIERERSGGFRRVVDPTPEEIAERAAEIRTRREQAISQVYGVTEIQSS